MSRKVSCNGVDIGARRKCDKLLPVSTELTWYLRIYNAMKETQRLEEEEDKLMHDIVEAQSRPFAYSGAEESLKEKAE